MIEKLEADVVIIGSGIAGAMTAYRLAQAGVKVLVLEAGPRVDRAKIVEGFTNTHKLDLSSGFPNCNWAPRPDWAEGRDSYMEYSGPEVAKIEYLRVVGGTTWHWSANTVRLLPNEMRMKTLYGVGIDWPIGYDDLELFYCEAEKEMGVAGDSDAPGDAPRSKPLPLTRIPMSYSDRAISTSLKSIGIDFIHRPVARNSKPYDGRTECQGFGTCSPICPSGAQYAAIFHVEKSEKLGVRVMENTRVDKLSAAADGRITQVQARRSDGTQIAATARVFLLAANGMESPRLLLMGADESRPAGLANTSGHVGRNFFEHPGIYCRMKMPKNVYPRGPESTITSFTFRDGDFRRNRAGWSMSVYNRLHMHDISNELLLQGMSPPELDVALRDRAFRQLEIDAHMEQLPQIENGITLDPVKRDKAGQPVMRFYYSFSEYEQAGLEHARQTFGRIVRAAGAEMLSVSAPFAHHHPMGMTMMGTDRKTSVVDPHCRAHDHQNLFIVSSAVFPSGGCANPTLTIAALALRAAGEIERQLKA